MTAYLTSRHSPASLEKAKQLLQEKRVEAREGSAWRYLVGGSKPYEVRILSKPEDWSDEGEELPWVTCTCNHGRHAGGEASCYHAAAVLIMLKYPLSPEKEMRSPEDRPAVTRIFNPRKRSTK